MIDSYTHFLPPDYADLIARTTSRKHGDVADIKQLQAVFPNLCDADLRLGHMDRYRTELQVLTPLPIPPEQFIAPGDQQTAGTLCRVANDALANVIARDSRRFVGVALLSYQDVDEAAAEMDRAVLRLGFKGAMLFTNIAGTPLDSPTLFPVYQRACELDVPLWIHPVSWNYYDWVRDHLIWQIFGWPIDTTLAMARIVYGGVFDRFPSLKLITHHGGGTVPFLIGRVVDTYDQVVELSALVGDQDKANQAENRSPIEGFRMFFADTALSGIPSAAQSAYDLFGANRLVFGSDYPFGPEQGERFIRANLAALQQLNLEQAVLAQILEGNARHLLHDLSAEQETAAD